MHFASTCTFLALKIVYEYDYMKIVDVYIYCMCFGARYIVADIFSDFNHLYSQIIFYFELNVTTHISTA